jgi:hypothetical protein
MFTVSLKFFHLQKPRSKAVKWDIRIKARHMMARFRESTPTNVTSHVQSYPEDYPDSRK